MKRKADEHIDLQSILSQWLVLITYTITYHALR